MSYDLALWVGPPPANDVAAAEEFVRRTAYLEDEDEFAELAAATPQVRAFLDELLLRFPPLTALDVDENTPWATGPEPGDVNGDFVYLTMTYPGARRVCDGIVAIARRHALVCYDPQLEQVVS